MTYTVKVNCDKLKVGVGIFAWILSTSIFGFGVYVQEVTLTTYDHSNLCHTNFFTGEHKCLTEILEQNGVYLYPGDVRVIEFVFIAVIIGIQLVVFFTLNDSRKWIEFQCSNEKPFPNEVKQE